MDEDTAEHLAELLGGDAWQSGGNIWLVTLRVADGKLVVFSGDAVCQYADEDAFEENRAEAVIPLV